MLTFGSGAFGGSKSPNAAPNLAFGSQSHSQANRTYVNAFARSVRVRFDVRTCSLALNVSSFKRGKNFVKSHEMKLSSDREFDSALIVKPLCVYVGRCLRQRSMYIYFGCCKLEGLLSMYHTTSNMITIEYSPANLSCYNNKLLLSQRFTARE